MPSIRSSRKRTLAKDGWKWGCKYEGRWMALSVSAFDADHWLRLGAGEVYNLETGEKQKNPYYKKEPSQ